MRVLRIQNECTMLCNLLTSELNNDRFCEQFIESQFVLPNPCSQVPTQLPFGYYKCQQAVGYKLTGSLFEACLIMIVCSTEADPVGEGELETG